MKNAYTLSSVLLLCACLSACGGGGGGGGSGSSTASDNSGNTANPPGVSTPSPRLPTLAAANANSEASAFGTTALQQDILRLVGGADGEPFAVNSDDTALTAINRAAGQ